MGSGRRWGSWGTKHFAAESAGIGHVEPCYRQFERGLEQGLAAAKAALAQEYHHELLGVVRMQCAISEYGHTVL